MLILDLSIFTPVHSLYLLKMSKFVIRGTSPKIILTESKVPQSREQVFQTLFRGYDIHPQFTLRTSSEMKKWVLRTSSEMKKRVLRRSSEMENRVLSTSSKMKNRVLSTSSEIKIEFHGSPIWAGMWGGEPPPHQGVVPPIKG